MKNMLAMVQSIATQTMRTATDLSKAQDVLAARLIALSKSHDLLLGGSLGSTQLNTMVENAIQLHRDMPERFVIAGPAVNVGARASMSLSLMLHELATNAAKYGALSISTGQVSITWDLLPDGADPKVRLRWAESGGPLVAVPTRYGFGSRLIGRGLSGNFGGEVTLDYHPTGVVCTVTAPMSGLHAEDAPAQGGYSRRS